MGNLFGKGTVIFILWLIFGKRWQSHPGSNNRAYSADKRLDELPLISGLTTGGSKFVEVRDEGNNLLYRLHRDRHQSGKGGDREVQVINGPLAATSRDAPRTLGTKQARPGGQY